MGFNSGFKGLKTDASGTWYTLVQVTFIFSVQPPPITNQTSNRLQTPLFSPSYRIG